MNKKLLTYICCPACKKDLNIQKSLLYCKNCKVFYDIKNDIPILLVESEMTPHMIQQINYFDNEDKSRPSYKLQAWQKSYLRRFYNSINLKQKSVVVDVASGSGYMAVELAKKGHIVIASDITLTELQKIHKAIKKYSLESNLFLVCCSAESLPFKSNIADVVTENAIIEHLHKEKQAIEEIDRITKKNSWLMVSTPLSYKYLNPLLIPVNYYHDKRIGHLRRYNENDFRNKFNKWKIKQVYYSGHFMKFVCFALGVLAKTSKFDKYAEDVDIKSENVKYGASVITVFLTR